jgi:CRP/FNR family transcriptional regulator
MFRGVASARLAALARRAAVREARAASSVLRHGEPVPGLMVVRHGLVKLSLGGDPQRVLRLVGPGESFAEAPLLAGEPAQLDAVAVTPCALVIVPREPLLALFERDRLFARLLLATLCRRALALVAEFEATAVHGARERLAGYLCSLGDAARLPAPKAVIASRLGMTKETLSRLLRAFIDEGLIAVSSREIRVLDRPRLTAAGRA